MKTIVKALPVFLIMFCLAAGVSAATFAVNTTDDTGAVELAQFAGGPFSISGTITAESGIPIRNIVVVLSEGGLSEPRYTVTGSLGNYQFTNVPASGYTVSISSKRFFFAEDGQFVNVPFDRTGINFSGVQQTTPRTTKSERKTPLLPEEGWQPLRLTGWWECDRVNGTLFPGAPALPGLRAYD